MKGPALFQGGIIKKYRKYIEEMKKIFFFRTTGPISTKLVTKHSWVKGIQVCSNEGPSPFPRASSLAKGFTHGPLFLHPWQIELDFVIPADRHLAVFTSPAYKDDITFDQWVLLKGRAAFKIVAANLAARS